MVGHKRHLLFGFGALEPACDVWSSAGCLAYNDAFWDYGMQLLCTTELQQVSKNPRIPARCGSTQGQESIRTIAESRQMGPNALYVGLSANDRFTYWLPAVTQRLTLLFLDQWHYEACQRLLDQDEPVRCICEPDLPADGFDTIVLSVSFQGEAELTRELIQQAHQRLVWGGWLWTLVDNPNDRWVAEQLQQFFGNARDERTNCHSFYESQKRRELKKRKDFSCRFAFRDQGVLIQVFSRPGVFAHRRVDGGTRRLLEAMQVGPGMHVLEIGCGSGVVSLAAAARQPTAQVLAVDSATRAVECLKYAAQLNGFTNLRAAVYAQNDYRSFGTFDLIITNPPYYSHFEIARRFLEGASQALNPGGELLLVTKQPTWYQQNVCRWFHHAALEPVKAGYWILRATIDRPL